MPFKNSHVPQASGCKPLMRYMMRDKCEIVTQQQSKAPDDTANTVSGGHLRASSTNAAAC